MRMSYSKKIQFLTIDACSYKLIRSIDLDGLVKFVGNADPFNPKVIGCINHYFNVFKYLHSHVGKMDKIVRKECIEPWSDLLLEVIFKGFNSYLQSSTSKAIRCCRQYTKVELFSH